MRGLSRAGTGRGTGVWRTAGTWWGRYRQGDGERVRTCGMREGRDPNRPLDPGRDTDCSSICRYDTVFASWVCLALALLTLECQFVNCFPQLLLGCSRDVTSLRVLHVLHPPREEKPPSPWLGSKLLIEDRFAQSNDERSIV